MNSVVVLALVVVAVPGVRVSKLVTLASRLVTEGVRGRVAWERGGVVGHSLSQSKQSNMLAES